MLLFLFITLAIGLILFFDGYEMEMKKGVDKDVCIKSTEKRKKKKSLWWHMWHDDSIGTTYPGYKSY